MKKNNQKYGQEFIDSAVKLVESSGNAAAVARDLGIESWRLRSWVRKASKNSGENKSIADENKRLKRELAQAKEENEILKKAAGYFARHQK